MNIYYEVIIAIRKGIIKLRKKSYPRRIKAVRIANAVNKIEGVQVTESMRRLSIQWAQGEITGEAMKLALITKHNQTSSV